MKRVRASAASGLAVRFLALLRKEFRQMVRDRSNLLMGVALPMILILLFGYGISFDVEEASVALVNDSRSGEAAELVRSLEGSKYLRLVPAAGMPQAVSLVQKGEAQAIVRLPVDFAERFARGEGAVQVILNGVDAQNVKTVEGYVSAALAAEAERRADRAGGKSASGVVVLTPRVWFNEASRSLWFLTPGIITLVLTLIGAFLASLLIAREWERGTFESLFVTPARPLEIVLAKVIPYAGIGIIDIVLCLLAARFLFEVPVRGAVPLVFFASLLYLFVTLLLGLLISGLARSQFLASQAALLASFLPSLILSGFVFDIRNMPGWLVPLCNLLPATHFMRLAKELFLAGTVPADVARGFAILALYALLLAWGAARTVEKRLR